MPSWSPDGTSVYFIRTTDALGLWPAQGVDRHYQESVPAIMRVDAGGATPPEQIMSGAHPHGQPIVVLVDPPAGAVAGWPHRGDGLGWPGPDQE